MNRWWSVARLLAGVGVVRLSGIGRSAAFGIVVVGLLALFWTYARDIHDERDRAQAEAESLRVAHRTLATRVASYRIALARYESVKGAHRSRMRRDERTLADVPDDPDNTLEHPVPASVVRMVRPDLGLGGVLDTAEDARHHDGARER